MTPLQRWFLPHLTLYMAAVLGGIALSFTLVPHLAFPIFALLSLWGLGVALHAYRVVIGKQGGQDE